MFIGDLLGEGFIGSANCTPYFCVETHILGVFCENVYKMLLYMLN